jgi:hypothetical protein
MKGEYKYLGAFISPAELTDKINIKGAYRLDRIIANPHVTFEFKPDQANRSLFGKKISLKVTGYGNDGKNEGLRVEIFTDDPDLCEMAKRIALPHITVSVSSDSEPVRTRYIEFFPIEPFFMEAVYGGLSADDEVITCAV